MTTRVLLAGLVLANALFLAWTQGWLEPLVGLRATGDREPQRLAQQVRPEAVRVVTPEALAAEVLAVETTAAQARRSCLEAGPFDARSLGPAEASLVATLPAGTWSRVTSERDGTLVYMLRVQSADQELAVKVAGLHLDALGKGFLPCGRPTP